MCVCVLIYGKNELQNFILYSNGMQQRITFAEVIANEWFKKGYKPPIFEQSEVILDNVSSIFNDTGVRSFVLFVYLVILLLACA